MTRLSGMRLLALSFVLWAMAVWLFGTPQPAETESTATTETTSHASGEANEDSGAGQTARAHSTEESSAGAPARQGGTAPTDPDTGAGDAPPRASAEQSGSESASMASPGGDSESPADGARMSTAASGGGSHVVPAPENISGDRTHVPDATDAGPGRGSTNTPGGPVTGGAAGIARGPDVPPVPSQRNPWFDHPLSRPRLPAESDFSARPGTPVEAQLNAARRAAWEGRFSDALAHYRAAARLQPNDYVVWGEMGNVLWTMQRWSEAAYALEGAATLLVRAGELRAASDLVPAVGRLDPEAAYRIQRLLWAAAQRQAG